MYNDTIKVANKIISDSDLMDIFQKMNEEMLESENVFRQETIQNEKLEREYQNWTTKDLSATFKCTFNFYDDTNITVDNYNSFITVYNNRIQDIKNMWVRYQLYYWIEHGREPMKSVSQHIDMNIYEDKMDITVSLSSEDNRMNDVYQLIKNKILQAPEKYDRIIKKRNAIMNKIGFAVGIIPSLIFCTLLALVTTIRHLYAMSYVLFPVAAILLGFLLGAILFRGKLDDLYETIVPKKKYAGYDTTHNRSIYKDDIDDYLNTSEIIIGKNINNIRNRKEIAELEEKYAKYIPAELIAILLLSIIVVVIGKFI